MRVFFLVVLYRPGGLKGPKCFFKKRPGHTVNVSGRLFTPANNSAFMLWHPLSPVAAIRFVASAPSSYLARVIACLDRLPG